MLPPSPASLWPDRSCFAAASTDYAQERLRSNELDHAFGFRLEAIEASLCDQARALSPLGNHQTLGPALHEGHQTWVGLPPGSLQTPYSEFLEACDLAKPPHGSTVIDLGAGYGRLGLVLDRCFPGVQFIGFEYVRERVEEGNRVLSSLGCSSARLIAQDLGAKDFHAPAASLYFTYDFGRGDLLERTLKQLQALAREQSIAVIGRGRMTRSRIENNHPWLSQIHAPVHRNNFSLYRS